MATPAVEAEVAAVEQLHQAAQARLGIAAAYLALAQWQNLSALNPQAGAAAWVVVSLRIIVAVRKLSRQLAINYVQLVRGLETGSTLGAPANSTGDVTLGTLRKNFRDLTIDIADIPSPTFESDDADIRWFEEQLRSTDLPKAKTPGRLIRLDDAEVDPLIQDFLDAEGSDNAGPVSVDEFEWPDDMDELDAADAFEDLLKNQIKDAADKVKDLRSNDELTPDQVLTQIEKNHQSAGSLGSGIVDAAGMQGGRETIDRVIRGDRKVKMIARGTSGDPCAFCAMLASRGFVYTGATSGVGGEITVSQDIREYHKNCHCFPIVKYTTTSQLPELNRYFQEQWPDVTAGNSGLDALNAWRRWIYAKRKINPDAPHGARNNKPT